MIIKILGDCESAAFKAVKAFVKSKGHTFWCEGYRCDLAIAPLLTVKVPDEELKKLKGLDVLIVSALRKRDHISHQTLDEAVALIHKIEPKQAYLTHLSHKMGLHDEVESELEEGIGIAYDGMELKVKR